MVSDKQLIINHFRWIGENEVGDADGDRRRYFFTEGSGRCMT
jgi:hypothetical protein